MTDAITPATAEPSFREQVAAVETSGAAPPPPPNDPPEVAVGGEDEQPPPQEKFVPLGALHEERQKRKNAEAAARQRDNEFAQYQQRAEERLNYLQQLALQQQPQPQEPTFEQDPLTGTYKEVQRVGQEVAQIRKEQADRLQAEHRDKAVAHFVNTVQSSEAQFKEQNPDYGYAIDWAKGKKISEYIAVGMPEQQAVARVQEEAARIALDALQRGESPAEVGFRLARTMGYQPQPNAQDKLAMQKAGTAASTPSGGGGRGGKLSLDALLKMDSADFLKQTEGKNWKKLVGG